MRAELNSSDASVCPALRSPKKHWLFRIGAVVFGLSLLGILELGLRFANVGRHHNAASPMVEFSEIRPLFEKNGQGDRYQIPKYRQVFFQPESFSVKKATNEFRIFCFGGSTVQGRPYSIETSFTTWLELSLQAAQPEVHWEVINCGGVSYASYRLVPIVRETLQYSPDMLVVYTGHNEFLEQRTYRHVKRRPRWLRDLQDVVLQLRVAGLLRSILPTQQPIKKISLPSEVDALLDYKGGLAKYTRDDHWRDGVIYEYEQNLRRIVEIASEANVPMVFINPVSNIRDTAPFKVEPPKSFSPDERMAFSERWEAAKEMPWIDLQKKESLVREVLAMDSRHAEPWFLLAKVLESQQRYEDAKAAYLQAKDEDICPLRMLETMHQTLDDVARSTDIELIDIRSMFESEAEHGLPGDDQLIDHVHPRIEGHQRIAEEIFRHLQNQGVVKVSEGWEERRKQLYKSNYESLPNNYFPESVERLRGLQRWAAGRVERLRLPNAQEADRTLEDQDRDSD